ncbi:MAG: sigma-70 family RNA polymerase sigma factor [Planctomycetes bacterium]|nr:sigma-70 family RNA polymerase sigma factor [Planctomycetota bacterium]
MHDASNSNDAQRAVTLVLQRIEAGDVAARDELFKLLYAELHLRARAYMNKQPNGGTLQPTALVHEVFLKLCHGSWTDRKHFLIAASQAMRHVLIEHHRARRTGHVGDEFLENVAAEFEERAGDMEALHQALQRLKERDPDMERAVVLRFYGGVEEEEVARMLGISLRTFQRRWAETRQELYKAVS